MPESFSFAVCFSVVRNLRGYKYLSNELCDAVTLFPYQTISSQSIQSYYILRLRSKLFCRIFSESFIFSIIFFKQTSPFFTYFLSIEHQFHSRKSFLSHIKVSLNSFHSFPTSILPLYLSIYSNFIFYSLAFSLASFI